MGVYKTKICSKDGKEKYISSFVSGILVTGRSSNLREFLAVDENYTITMVLQNLQNIDHWKITLAKNWVK